ncbi:MAG: MaoC/PaaZ C-terminal domain-containing protein [Pseudomonadota bacterium]
MSETIEGYRAGQELGASPWMRVRQADIDVFGSTTRDLEPLHNDPIWCDRNSPYDAPIAYGFQTLSYLTYFLHQATDGKFSGAHDTEDFPINCGFDRVRLITPVLSGSEIRGVFKIGGLEKRRPGELRLTLDFEVQIKGADKPAAVGQWVYLWVTGEGTKAVSRSAPS